jgi:hypothetical protein
MDIDLLKRHFAHIGARVQVRSDGGNSQTVAREHYLRVTDADFEKAAYLARPGKAPEQARGAENGEQNRHPPGIAQSSLLLQIVQKVLEEQGLEQFGATVVKALQNYQAPPVGLEPTTQRLTAACSTD